MAYFDYPYEFQIGHTVSTPDGKCIFDVVGIVGSFTIDENGEWVNKTRYRLMPVKYKDGIITPKDNAPKVVTMYEDSLVNFGSVPEELL